MNLPGFTAETSIYKSNIRYMIRGILGGTTPSHVNPAMYPGWQQMHPFIDPFWSWGSGWTGDESKKTFSCDSGICEHGSVITKCTVGQSCHSGCSGGYPYAYCTGYAEE